MVAKTKAAAQAAPASPAVQGEQTTSAPTSAAKPVAAAARSAIAQQASAAVAKKQAESGRGAPGYAVQSWSAPPEGAHAPKRVPVADIQAIQGVHAKNGGGIYLVTDDRGHTSIVAVSADGKQVATHGGCVQAKRAAMYGLVHAGIYKLPVITALASEDVTAAIKERQAATQAQPATPSQ